MHVGLAVRLILMDKRATVSARVCSAHIPMSHSLMLTLIIHSQSQLLLLHSLCTCYPWWQRLFGLINTVLFSFRFGRVNRGTL